MSFRVCVTGNSLSLFRYRVIVINISLRSSSPYRLDETNRRTRRVKCARYTAMRSHIGLYLAKHAEGLHPYTFFLTLLRSH